MVAFRGYRLQPAAQRKRGVRVRQPLLSSVLVDPGGERCDPMRCLNVPLRLEYIAQLRQIVGPYRVKRSIVELGQVREVPSVLLVRLRPALRVPSRTFSAKSRDLMVRC